MSLEKPMNIAFLSTYPPRECGLATFTQDLVMELCKIQSTSGSRIIAVSNERLHYEYKVMTELSQNNRGSYTQTASALNNSTIELLVIEHEYGIYGGDRGEYLLDLIDNLQIPFVTTLHTVLPTPDDKQRHILNVLGEKGKKIITMARNTVDILVNVYGIEPSKIEVINHGVPYMPMQSRESLKAENGLQKRSVISTFGLLGPGKGLEYGVEAIAKVAKDHKGCPLFHPRADASRHQEGIGGGLSKHTCGDGFKTGHYGQCQVCEQVSVERGDHSLSEPFRYLSDSLPGP